MASSTASFINISSIYSTPLHQLPKSRTIFPPLSHFCSSEIKPLFTSFKASSFFRLSKNGGCGRSSAISTPNSSILSEKGFRSFGEDSLNVSERECESEDDVGSSNGDELEIIKLGLPQKLVESLAQRGITKLFPIQRAVLMPALEGRDLIARAMTGTGKTLAFAIPIIKRLNEDDLQKMPQRRSGRFPRALVLAPTRELALQVENEIKESAPSLSTVCIYGGVSYGIQQNVLTDGVDVVVGTPGRIIDLINSNTLKLGEIQFLVLDEADQMLAVGFEEDVEMILEQTPAERQSMLFSATMPLWVKNLSKKYLNNPITIDLVGDLDEKLPEWIKLYALPTTPTSKRRLLSDLVTVYAKGDKAIIFTQTKRDADEVSMSLTNSIASEALHGDISQPQRERTLNGFRKGRFTVLVATDVASRGLDIPNVDLVIHYELPSDAETFVHRSGRTGRAGKEGTAILMFNNNEKRTVRSLERDVGCKFEFIDPPAVDEVLESSSEQFVGTLGGVHPVSVEFFTPIAQKIIDEHGISAFAAALAQLSGFSRPPSSRSLISYEQGKVTLQLTLDRASVGRVFSAGSVIKLLSSVYTPAAEEIEKVHIIADATIHGAVFDLPEEVAEELLNKRIPSGNTISKITKLPDLQDDWAVNSNYGRFSNKDRSMRGENASNQKSYSASHGQGGGRFSKGGYSKQGGGWVGSRGGNWGGSRGGNNNSSSPTSTSSDLDWLITDKRSSSTSSGNSNKRSSNGACFTCGRSGHKSAECPTKRSY